MEWYLKALRQYADFDSRARRKEYWMFFLFNIIFFLGTTIVDSMMFGYPILTSLYWLGMIIPNLAVTVRRLHDTNKSGWFILISFVPFVGSIILLVFLCTEGTRGENQYGEDPKMEAEFI